MQSPPSSIKPKETCLESRLSPWGSPREKSDLPSWHALAHCLPNSAIFPARHHPVRKRYRVVRRQPTDAASGTRYAEILPDFSCHARYPGLPLRGTPRRSRVPEPDRDTFLCTPLSLRGRRSPGQTGCRILRRAHPGGIFLEAVLAPARPAAGTQASARPP
jgi:hypothetical protein